MTKSQLKPTSILVVVRSRSCRKDNFSKIGNNKIWASSPTHQKVVFNKLFPFLKGTIYLTPRLAKELRYRFASAPHHTTTFNSLNCFSSSS